MKVQDDGTIGDFTIQTSELDEIKKYLSIKDAEKNIQDILETIEKSSSEIIDQFYDYLDDFNILRKFTDEGKLTEKLKKTQREYLLSFGKNIDSTAYMERRIAIGMAHERIGLPHYWYFGGVLKLIEITIKEHIKSGNVISPEKSMDFMRVFLYDAMLSLRAYQDCHFAKLSELNEKLQLISQLDGLTNILNRKTLESRLDSELMRAKRYGEPFAVCMIDIDHFKRVNDTYGHQMGDAVLIGIVRAIQDNIRQIDHFGRYGGEEFTVGLVKCKLEKAIEICERVRSKIQEVEFAKDNSKFHVTVSIGITSVDIGERYVELQEMLKIADANLYKAKNSGRNRLCF